MPREIAHFIAADRLVLSLSSVRKLVEQIEYGRDILFLGAISADSPYYFPFGKSPELVAELIHGRQGEDTFQILRILKQSCCGESLKNKYLDVFILGFLSHVLLDVAVHPFVNMLSGDYYDDDPVERSRAVTMHRRLETDLDYHLLSLGENKEYAKFFSRRRQNRFVGGKKLIARELDQILNQLGLKSSFSYYWSSHFFLTKVFDLPFLGKVGILPAELLALSGRNRKPHGLFTERRFFPKGSEFYFKAKEEMFALAELYFYVLDWLVSEIDRYLENPLLYLSAKGPSLNTGKIHLS